MKRQFALGTGTLAILLLGGCSAASDGGDRSDDGNDDSGSADTDASETFEVTFDGDCIVPSETESDSFTLVSALPEGFEALTQPDCIYESGSSVYAVYLDGGDESIPANNAALAATGWEEVDTNTWDNQEVGTVSQAVIAADENPGGVPYGWKHDFALVNMSAY